MGKLAGDGNIKLYVKCTVQETGQSYATQDVVELRKPKLAVTVRRLRMKLTPQGGASWHCLAGGKLFSARLRTACKYSRLSWLAPNRPGTCESLEFFSNSLFIMFSACLDNAAEEVFPTSFQVVFSPVCFGFLIRSVCLRLRKRSTALIILRKTRH